VRWTIATAVIKNKFCRQQLLTFTANLPAIAHAQQLSVSVLDFVTRAMICGEPPHRAKECPTALEEVEETD